MCTSAKVRTSTRAAPAFLSAFVQASSVAPVVRTSSTRTKHFPATRGLASSGTTKASRTLRSRSLRSRPVCDWVALHRRRSCGRNGFLLSAADMAGKNGRLVVAPPPKPEAVKRDRDDAVRAREDVGPCTPHEFGHQKSRLMPVAIFERIDEALRRIIEEERGAGAIPRRRFGQCRSAQRALALIIGKGDCKLGAEGRLDKGKLRPAGGAQAGDFSHLAAASEALRRNEPVEPPSADERQAPGNVREGQSRHAPF